MFETRKTIWEEAIRKEIEKQLEEALEGKRARVRERVAQRGVPDDLHELVLQELVVRHIKTCG